MNTSCLNISFVFELFDFLVINASCKRIFFKNITEIHVTKLKNLLDNR